MLKAGKYPQVKQHENKHVRTEIEKKRERDKERKMKKQRIFFLPDMITDVFGPHVSCNTEKFI